MRQRSDSLAVATRRGLTEITPAVRAAVRASGVREGLCTVFLRHTSASLVIQENADPSVRRDLEAFSRGSFPTATRCSPTWTRATTTCRPT